METWLKAKSVPYPTYSLQIKFYKPLLRPQKNKSCSAYFESLEEQFWEDRTKSSKKLSLIKHPLCAMHHFERFT